MKLDNATTITGRKKSLLDLSLNVLLRVVLPLFPSKVGGRPAWLSLGPLPGPERLRCGGCGEPLLFLLQVVLPAGPPRAFHRALLLFCCRRRTACGRRSFLALRSQLPRHNPFYPPGAEARLKLCRVCGAAAPKSCSRCRRAHYCGREHQAAHWRAGHREACQRPPGEGEDVVQLPNFLFPEFELVMELEEEQTATPEGAEDQKSEDHKKHIEPDSVTCSMDDKELEAMAKHETKEDKIFDIFKKKIALAPDQVLRYCRGGSPLWVSGENIPKDTDIPNCSCGAKRIFEFQIMPQLLYYLKVDSLGESIDWGTLAVYTCEESCDHGNEYTTEFLWKQDFSADNI
eukprot:gi/632953986/ref/XP_007892720.1/ PREDICTED: programmed cell death protein 2 [Callorhinchus milii]